MIFASRSKSVGYVVTGLALGVIVELPALLAAFVSAGAGHGDYVSARALFPASMLLVLVEGRIGTFSIAVGLLQFPLYGVLLGWSVLRGNYLPAIVMASAHLIAVIACFAGALSNFL